MPMLQRVANFFAPPVANPAIAGLYRACVTQARTAEFYGLLGVPDTIDGRFDLLVLHVFLVIRRLGDEGEAKQQLFDLMFADMDQSLREMGVGDMGVGKRIKKMISAFYGRAQAYEKALAESDDVLAKTLQRNLYGTAHSSLEALCAMVSYMRQTISELKEQQVKNLLQGEVWFSSPPIGERG